MARSSKPVLPAARLALHADRCGEGGFSLIFMSILVTVGAIIMVSLLPEADNSNAKSISDVEKLERVEEHMRSFMAFNGRRPCPADGQYPITSKYFGQEAGTPGTCQGNVSPTPNAPLGPDASGYIIAGVIPTRSLGLDSSYAFDSYGRRFTYVVDRRATQTKSCLNLENLNSSYVPTGQGGITIDDDAGNPFDHVMYAYIQHGPEGYGAWPGDGSATTLSAAASAARRVNSGSTDLAMQMDAGVAPGANPGASTFVPDPINTLVKNSRIVPSTASGGLDTGFDDILWYRDDIKNTCCLGPKCVPAGFIAQGNANWVAAGYALAMGDVNGDGRSDLIIGGNSGNTFIVFGIRNAQISGAYADPLPLVTATGSIVDLTGPFPCSLTTADVNGDGIPDIIIGGNECVGTTGTTLVVYGKSTWNYATYSLDDVAATHGLIDGVQGFALRSGTTNDKFGYALAAGKIRGTAGADIAIGAPYATVSGVANAGKVYLYFAPVSTSATANGTTAVTAGSYTGLYVGQTVYSSSLSVPAGTYITGCPNPGTTTMGTACTSASLTLSNSVPTGSGTLNTTALPSTQITTTSGSSCATVTSYAALEANQTIAYSTAIQSGTLISAINANCTSTTNCSGANCVTLSKAATATGTNNMYIRIANLDSTYLNGANGAELDGDTSNANEYAGGGLAIGDVNGDSLDDLAIGEAGSSLGTPNGGSVYLVFGAGQWTTPQTMSSFANGTSGFRIDGRNNDSLGQYPQSIAIGDVNHDGYNDIALGSPYNNMHVGGKVYVVFGGSNTGSKYGGGTGWPATMSVANLAGSTGVNGSSGFELDSGTSYTGLGFGIAIADTNGDGNQDLILCNSGASGHQSASAISIFGGATTKSGGGWPSVASPISVTQAWLGNNGNNAVNGFELDAPSDSSTEGRCAIAAGDMTGDRKGEIALGAYVLNAASYTENGETFVVYGKKAFPLDLSLSGL